MQDTIYFTLEELSRDLAGQYAQGHMTPSEYLDNWETLTQLYIKGNNQNSVAV